MSLDAAYQAAAEELSNWLRRFTAVENSLWPPRPEAIRQAAEDATAEALAVLGVDPADLTNAERIWWCEEFRTADDGTLVACRRPDPPAWHSKCGNRLLVPVGEGNEQ